MRALLSSYKVLIFAHFLALPEGAFGPHCFRVPRLPRLDNPIWDIPDWDLAKAPHLSGARVAVIYLHATASGVHRLHRVGAKGGWRHSGRARGPAGKASELRVEG